MTYDRNHSAKRFRLASGDSMNAEQKRWFFCRDAKTQRIACFWAYQRQWSGVIHPARMGIAIIRDRLRKPNQKSCPLIFTTQRAPDTSFQIRRQRTR